MFLIHGLDRFFCTNAEAKNVEVEYVSPVVHRTVCTNSHVHTINFTLPNSLTVEHGV